MTNQTGVRFATSRESSFRRSLPAPDLADLSGVRAKLTRADEHLASLKTEAEKWAAPFTGKPAIDVERDGPWHVLWSRPGIAPPDPRLAAIAGDFVQNLRAALDHLVWQLVLREGNKPTDRNEFPIVESPARFRDEIRGAKRRDKTGLYGIPIDGDAWRVIEDAQPFNRIPDPEAPGDPKATPYGSPIAVLRRLSNADKHQSLLFQLPMPEPSSYFRAIGWSTAVTLAEHRITGVPIEPGERTEIIRLRFEPSP